VEGEEWEREDVADAKADGAGGEVMPRAAMVVVVVEADGGKDSILRTVQLQYTG